MSTVARPRGGALARPVLRPAAVLAVASASSFLVYLDATIVNVAFPDVRASFTGATLAGLSWILSAYAIVFAAGLVQPCSATCMAPVSRALASTMTCSVA